MGCFYFIFKKFYVYLSGVFNINLFIKKILFCCLNKLNNWVYKWFNLFFCDCFSKSNVFFDFIFWFIFFYVGFERVWVYIVYGI